MPADVIVFAKAPRLGAVKTRLARTLGDKPARDIYVCLLSTVFQALATYPRVSIWYSPDDALDDIRPWVRQGWEAHPQGAGDLGQRMLRAFGHAFGHGASRVIIIGSDCPEITEADIEEASSALASHDLVLGPARDGGYWLIGLAKLHPLLFQEIAWSSDQVFAQTLARATSLGLRVRALRRLSDVDTAQDWERYQRSRQARSGTPAPN